MKYRRLGSTERPVSVVGIGTWQFGGEWGRDYQVHEVRAILERARELGINLLDTAECYGDHVSERLIGEAIEGRRDEWFVATKFGHRYTGDFQRDQLWSADEVLRQLDASLEALRTDHVDLYQFHHIDRESPWDEIWQAIEVLVGAGKVLYAGSSNFAGWHIAEANEAARARHFLGLVSEQCKYNLLVRSVELEVLPACERYGLGVIPYSPLAGGVLGGALQKASEGRRSGEQAQKDIERLRPQLEAWETQCAEMGERPADVALAWLLHNPVVTAPIIGPRNVEQLDGTLRALEIELSDEALARLDELFPGPGGPGPEAWAW